MIQQARIYDIKKFPPDYQRAVFGVRVLTTRKWLQGISKSDIDMWLPEAGPSLELLFNLRDHEIEWPQFIERYKHEQLTLHKECRPAYYEEGELMNGKFADREPILVSPIQYLATLASTQLVTVLCWEQGEQCHRHTLVDLVRGEM